MQIYIFTYTQIYMYTYPYPYTGTYPHICTYIHIYLSTHVCIISVCEILLQPWVLHHESKEYSKIIMTLIFLGKKRTWSKSLLLKCNNVQSTAITGDGREFNWMFFG